MRFLGACLIAQVMFFWAKASGLLDWSWLMVFAPIWVPSSIGFFLMGAALMLAGYTPTLGERE